MPYPYRTFQEWFDEEEKLGNVVRIKTPIKCGDYSSIVDIGNEVPGKQPETEMRAVNSYLHSLPGKPIGFIEKPVNNRPDVPVIVNPWPGRERTLRGMGLKDKFELCEKLKNINKNKIKPLEVPKEKASCKEVIIPEEKVDMTKDIPRCWVEFNQVLWSACNSTIIIYDPQTGTHDLGKVRAGSYDWKDANPDMPFPKEKVKKYLFSTMQYLGTGQSNAGRYYYENYRKKGKPMPAVLCLGVPTDIHVVAAFRGPDFKWPETGDEYEAVGAFRQEPIEVVASETIPGLKVPAQAEWIIEGEYLPEDEVMPPYAEDIASGYMFGGESCPIFRVKCITHRKDPWWTATTFSASTLYGHEAPHSGLAFVHSEADAINFLRGLGFKVKDVVTVDRSIEIIIVQLEVDGAEKPYPHYGKQVAMALHGNPSRLLGVPTKYIIVVGPDIDPYDLHDVMWAIGTRTMPVSDSIVIEKGLALWADPGATPGTLGWKTYGEQVMIDALIKVPERYDTFPPRCDPADWSREAIERIRKKVGQV